MIILFKFDKSKSHNNILKIVKKHEQFEKNKH